MMKKLKKTFLMFALLFALALGAWGCGQADEDEAALPPNDEAVVGTVSEGASDLQEPSLKVNEEPNELPASSDEQKSDESQTLSADSAAVPEAQNNEAAPQTSDAAESTPVSVPESAPAPAPAPAPSDSQATSTESNLSETALNVQFGDGDTFELHLYDNETAAKIAEYVGTAAWQLPIYHYDDYDHWEVMQFYDIPSRYDIPDNAQQVTSEKAGTVYYSEPNRIVLFYQDAEVSGAYTPVGYIDYSEAFVEAVVNNPVVPGWSNKLVHISIRD